MSLIFDWVTGFLKSIFNIKKIFSVGLYAQIADLEKKNHDLQNENIDLKKRIALKETLKFNGKHYMKDGEAFPYCARCFENLGLGIHLFKIERHDDQTGYRCHTCNDTFWD